jgi:hypothetical protein
MKIAPCTLIVLAMLSGFSTAQSGTPQKRHLLVIGEEKGYRHESVSHAIATIERLGTETGLWESTLRTDTEALTKKKLEYNAKNLTNFDAVLFLPAAILKWTPSKSLTSCPLSMTTERGSLAFTVPPLPLLIGQSTAR